MSIRPLLAFVLLASPAAGQVFVRTGTLQPADLATLSVPIETTSTINDLRIGLGAGSISTNLGIGANTLEDVTSGATLTAVGYQAGMNVTTAQTCTLIGAEAGQSVTTAGDQTLIGYRAGQFLSTGATNTAVGSMALRNATTASSCNALGRAAGFNVQSGTGGIFIGGNAAMFLADGSTAYTVTSNSIYIGANAKAKTASDDNSIAIGGGVISEGSNTTTIGIPATAQTHIFGGLLHRRRVQSLAVDTVLSASDTAGTPGGANGQVYQNDSAGASARTHTLPSVTAGMHLTFFLSATGDVTINPQDDDQILGLTNAVGDAVSSDGVVGSWITLVGLSSTSWGVVGSAGAWTDVN